ncbi:Hypothetical_protein [Hexamita inflata]|uniref:Hypothetical_protein n=1 Tax=Hexamita inflata TaxID=28002 RepID=A0AA86S084_9EUKA|nr:Hypothetical protein HINF_LOCUS63415 [Hexamita inflata]
MNTVHYRNLQTPANNILVKHHHNHITAMQQLHHQCMLTAYIRAKGLIKRVEEDIPDAYSSVLLLSMSYFFQAIIFQLLILRQVINLIVICSVVCFTISVTNYLVHHAFIRMFTLLSIDSYNSRFEELFEIFDTNNDSGDHQSFKHTDVFENKY